MTCIGLRSVIHPTQFIHPLRAHVIKRSLTVSSQKPWPPAAATAQSPTLMFRQPGTTIWQQEPSKTSGRVMIVDGNAVLYRAYYKIQACADRGRLHESRANRDCEWVVLSAVSTMLEFLELGPSHAVICFDAKGLNFRHEMFPEYKKHRTPTPDTVTQAMPYLKAALVAMGLPIMQVYGVEADDVIGTLTVSALKSDMEVAIASPDKDFFQLLTPHVTLLRPKPRGQDLIYFRIEDFRKKYGGAEPSQFVDILALMGDQSDNVPGVFGIGEKNAPKLILEFGSLENLCLNIGSISQLRLRKAMENGVEMALLSKELVKLRTDLPLYMVDNDWGKYTLRAPGENRHQFWKMLDVLEAGMQNSFRLRERVRTLWGS